jgi:hypothetical protein
MLFEAGITKRSGVPAQDIVFNCAIAPLVDACSIASVHRKVESDGFLNKITTSYHSCAASRLFSNKSYDWKAFNNLRVEELQSHERTRAKKGGLIILDDVVLRKSGKHMEGIAYVFDPVEKKSVLGYNLVVLYYSDEAKSYPLSFELKLKDKKTRVEIAIELVKEVAKMLETRLITFDSWYFSNRLVSLLRALGFVWVTKAKKNRIFMLNGRKVAARKIISLGIREAVAELPGYGKVKIAVVNIGRERKLLVTNKLEMDAEEMKSIYSERFEIDNPFFRESKQELGLANFHTRSLSSINAHVAICFLSHTLLVVAKLLSRKLFGKSIGWLKERLIAIAAFVEKVWGRIVLAFKPKLRWIVNILGLNYLP